ncbi:MAG TPA: MBL fold metallo-hydrolase, partial [Chitinophagaceae bacterium]|nr:MBL fold metallo-hydrolase [Chitinophagaceae bacterium]
LYTGCLSEAAYYIESEGEAAVIDPLRDTEEYLALAKQRNASIKYIFETHFHADFVSGHIDLGHQTGAPIIYGPGTVTSYPVTVAADGQVFKLGKVSIKVLHTPGHTLESACYLLLDEDGKEHAVFTGDTLFVGDVGRPDLAQDGNNITMQDLAGMLYDSLQQKILTLPDDVLVYPAHGPGSSCGKNLGPNTYSTIGEEKQTNYALRTGSREAFISAVTEGLAAPPQYFPVNAKINKEGYESLDKILRKALQPLSVTAFKEKTADESVIILDTRDSTEFVNGFVPGAISIGLDGRFAEWAGMLLPFDKPIVLVTAPGKEEETAVRLARVGFSTVEGFLEGSFAAWQAAGEKTDMIVDIEADELAMDLPHDKKMLVVDVRRETEFADGHVKGALNIPLNDMTDPATMADLDESKNLYLHCAGGYRSIIAASLLKRQGIHNLHNVMGGWAKIKEQKNIPTAKETSVLN